jgi:hypothetical protein
LLRGPIASVIGGGTGAFHHHVWLKAITTIALQCGE